MKSTIEKCKEVESGILPKQPQLSLGIFSPSQGGKTTLACSLLQNFSRFYPDYTIRKLIIFCRTLTNQHEELIKFYKERQIETLIFNDLSQEVFANKTRIFADGHQNDDEDDDDRMAAMPQKAVGDSDNDQRRITLVLIDDLEQQLGKNDNLVELVCVLTHHLSLFVIYTAHALFAHNTRSYRTFLNNLQIYAIGNSIKLRNSFKILFSQLFGIGTSRTSEQLLELARKDWTKRYSNVYYFLFIDVSSARDESMRVYLDPLSSYPICYNIKH